MNSAEFDAYLQLSDDQKKDLWGKATFVLDTNVLLNLYKLGNATRTQVMALLRETLAGKVWIPYHVAVEFYRNREGHLTAERQRIQAAVDSLSAAEAKLFEAVKQSNLSEIGIKEDAVKLDSVTEAIAALTEQLGTALNSSPDLHKCDTVLEFVRDFIGKSIGSAPTNQQEIDLLIADGEDRYLKSIPPGYKDRDKKQESFIHDGHQYMRKFGDLIIWRQILAYFSRPDGPKHLIFVTAERKDDWWEKNDKGQLISPRIELRQEALRRGILAFHMYHFSNLLERLVDASRLPSKVPQEVIEEVQRQEAEADENAQKSDSFTAFAIRRGVPQYIADHVVRVWMRGKYPTAHIITTRDGFPFLVVERMIPESQVREHIGVSVITSWSFEGLERAANLEITKAAHWISDTKGEFAIFETRRRFVVVIVLQSDSGYPDEQRRDSSIGRLLAMALGVGVALYCGSVVDGEFVLLPLSQ